MHKGRLSEREDGPYRGAPPDGGGGSGRRVGEGRSSGSRSAREFPDGYSPHEAMALAQSMYRQAADGWPMQYEHSHGERASHPPGLGFQEAVHGFMKDGRGGMDPRVAMAMAAGMGAHHHEPHSRGVHHMPAPIHHHQPWGADGPASERSSPTAGRKKSRQPHGPDEERGGSGGGASEPGSSTLQGLQGSPNSSPTTMWRAEVQPPESDDNYKTVLFKVRAQIPGWLKAKLPSVLTVQGLHSSE